jgi:hypothetical protein
MTREKTKRTLQEIKELIAQEEDLLRPLIGAVLQEILEAEMSQALGAEKGERVQGRLGYRSGYYVRSLITRVGKLELRVGVPLSSEPKRTLSSVAQTSAPWERRWFSTRSMRSSFPASTLPSPTTKRFAVL